MAQTTIAIIADCDDTLAPDTTGQLLRLCGVDSQDFFQNQSNPLVREGWDPSLAYMHTMTQLATEGRPLADLTQERIKELAESLEFFPGVPECFTAVKNEIENDSTFRAAGIHVECYVISGGIGELLRASVLNDVMHYIWACDFAYDEQGVIAHPKSTVSFTEKTKFLFMINKGVIGPSFAGQAYAVNAPMRAEERPVPFENMVYLGDGPSDIPCMSLLQSNGGYVLGVEGVENLEKAFALAYGRRAHQTVEPDFTVQGRSYRILLQAVRSIASRIAQGSANIGVAPQH